jgi:hypothetical protein
MGVRLPTWRYAMADTGAAERRRAGRAEREVVRELIATYHRTRLRALLERVRDGLVQLDAGDIDVFELDNLIHHDKRSATELWKFCGSSAGQWQQAASALTYMREQRDEPVWWERGVPRRDRIAH